MLRLRCAALMCAATCAVAMDAAGHGGDSASASSVRRAELDDVRVVAAVQWAVDYLSTMSNSGVYRSLSLRRIVAAATQRGAFHDNIIATVELVSPHIMNGQSFSTHQFIIMSDLNNPSDRTFALDDFPLMDPKAVEAFWRRKVDASTAAREEELVQLSGEGGHSYQHSESCGAPLDADAIRMLQRDPSTLTLDEMVAMSGSGAARVLDTSSASTAAADEAAQAQAKGKGKKRKGGEADSNSYIVGATEIDADGTQRFHERA